MHRKESLEKEEQLKVMNCQEVRSMKLEVQVVVGALKRWLVECLK
jgi:hypothetical protein